MKTRPIKTYSAAIDYLYHQLPMFQNTGKIDKIDLRKIKALCNWLGNPQKTIRCIHVAGTNGKGSISHLLASVLHTHGFKVGLYTSPHYRDYRERIKINGVLIPKSFVTKFTRKFQEEYSEEISPSFFELSVAMAFEYFKQEQCDIVIVETGLGGRLDSTNIITPILSIISNISFDHQAFLGNTLKKIAKEKAGIIKKNIPVLIGEYQKEVWDVFKQTAKKRQSKIYKAESLVKTNVSKNKIEVEIKKDSFPIKFDWLADYQLKNLRTAIGALHLLDSLMSDFAFNPAKIKTQLPKLLVEWKYIGRMQLLQKNPQIILDSAHNLAGIQEWQKMIHNQKYDRLHIVFGTVKDKNPSKILKMLPTSAKYYFVHAKIPRALKSEVLQSKAEEYHLYGKAYKSVAQGLRAAKLSASSKDLISVCGSIFVVAELV